MESLRSDDHARENAGTYRAPEASLDMRGSISAETPAKSARRLYLKLTAPQREEVLRILLTTPGDICVMLHMADEKKTYQALKEYWVSEGYQRAMLEEVLGTGNVVLK